MTKPSHFESYIFKASRSGNIRSVIYLIEQTKTILNEKDSYEKNPLQIAPENGRLPIVQYFVEHGCNINGKDVSGLSPLHYASWNGNIPIFQYFVEHGCNIDEKDAF